MNDGCWVCGGPGNAPAAFTRYCDDCEVRWAGPDLWTIGESYDDYLKARLKTKAKIIKRFAAVPVDFPEGGPQHP